MIFLNEIYVSAQHIEKRCNNSTQIGNVVTGIIFFFTCRIYRVRLNKFKVNFIYLGTSSLNEWIIFSQNK